MILTKTEIKKRMEKGQITIMPFVEENLNPDSYDLTLAPKLLMYTDPILDPKRTNPTREVSIPEEGLVLHPGELYIGSVNEFTEAKSLVGVLYGKSSLGRLGLFVHITAGFIDSGYAGKLTLELAVVRPVRVYAGMKIGQIAYSEEKGESTTYSGKYMNDTGPQASKSFKDFK
jgi:dCTP deaminase